jgi:hypothetical protein
VTAWADRLGEFWPAFEAAGMLVRAEFALPDCPAPVPVLVTFRQPDDELGSGSRSREYSIEYQHADLPGLDEGAQCVIDGTLYRVRERPKVPNDRNSASGFFRRALLSRVEPTP